MTAKTRVMACIGTVVLLSATFPGPRPIAAEEAAPSCESNFDGDWPLPGEYEGTITAEWKRPAFGGASDVGRLDGVSTITGEIWIDIRDDETASVTLTLDSQTLLGDAGNWSIDETLHAVFEQAELAEPTDLGGPSVTLQGSATGLFRAKDNPHPNMWIDQWDAYGAAQDPNTKNPSTSLDLIVDGGGCSGLRGRLQGAFIDRVLVAGYYWTAAYPNYDAEPVISWTVAPKDDPLAAAWAPYQRRLDALPSPPKGEEDRAAIVKEVGEMLREIASREDGKERDCLMKRLLDWYVAKLPMLSQQIVDEMIVELSKLANAPDDPYGTRFYVLSEEWIELDRLATSFGTGCGLVRTELARMVAPAETAELAIAKAGECPVALYIDRYVKLLNGASASDELYAICEEQDSDGGRPNPLGDWEPGPVSALVANGALAYAQTAWVMTGDSTSIEAITDAIVEAGWVLREAGN